MLELEYALLQHIGPHLSIFLRRNYLFVLRLYWKSRQKHKICLIRGEEDRVVELFYEDEPRIQQQEMLSLIEFVGLVEYIDLSFIDFDPDPIFASRRLDSTRYIFGLHNRCVTPKDFYRWLALDRNLQNLRILDLSKTQKLLTQQVIEELDGRVSQILISHLRIGENVTRKKKKKNYIDFCWI